MKTETMILLVVGAAVIFFVMKDRTAPDANTSGATNNPNVAPSPTAAQQVGGIVSDIFGLVDSIMSSGKTIAQSSPSTL